MSTAGLLRLLTYNIRQGGHGRERAIAATIASANPDVVLLQEARVPDQVNRIADFAGFRQFGARRGESLAFISRAPVEHAEWHKPRVSRHAFLEVVPAAATWRLFGVHLSAVHAAWTEQRRVFELRALLRAIAAHQHGPHVLTGDFNTLAPGELLDPRKLPARLRALLWLSGGQVRWRTIQTILDAGYRDAFRQVHPDLVGSTFPTWDPHIRLDYLFVPTGFADRVAECRVIDGAEGREASDHFPLVGDLRN